MKNNVTEKYSLSNNSVTVLPLVAKMLYWGALIEPLPLLQTHPLAHRLASDYKRPQAAEQGQNWAFKGAGSISLSGYVFASAGRRR